MAKKSKYFLEVGGKWLDTVAVSKGQARNNLVNRIVGSADLSGLNIKHPRIQKALKAAYNEIPVDKIYHKSEMDLSDPNNPKPKPPKEPKKEHVQGSLFGPEYKAKVAKDYLQQNQQKLEAEKKKLDAKKKLADTSSGNFTPDQISKMMG